MVWVLARVLVGRPPVAAAAVLIVLCLFMLIVPWRVPVVRAAIMAALFALGYGSGRLVRGMDLLALAALVVLIWRPTDLFDAGFQLSFCAVAGLILFTRPVGQWIRREPGVGPTRWPWTRPAVDYLAVNLVAFAVVLPLVARHFQIITPWAIVLSMLALPIVSITLGLGYAKVVLGLLYPTAGQWLALPVALITDAMMGLVEHASTWPWATIELPRAPSAIWVLSALGLVLAVLSGRFAGRRAALTAAGVVCLLWLAAGTMPGTVVARRLGFAHGPPLRVNMLAVGDGSCYLLRIGRPHDDPQVIMFDCGSQQYLSVALKTVLPSLRYLGVHRIDTLIVSHADLDHYGGTLDLLDHLPVGQVLMPRYLLEEAGRDDESAAAFLIQQLRARSVSMQTIGRGWQQTHGSARLDVLWPPPDLVNPHRNDTSIVLRISVSGRRVMLCGDIGQDAMTRLLDDNVDLRADVCDLPHHGSYVEASPRWLRTVGPTLVLQSCGRRRLQNDKWHPRLSGLGIQRLITARHGMVELSVEQNGTIKWSVFRKADGSMGVRKSRLKPEHP